MQMTVSQNGYTLLIAVLVSSIVLSVGVGLLNIVQKELTLAALGRDSQFAFYAADTGWECAFLWHVGGETGGTCAGEDISWGEDGVFELYFANESCANVTVRTGEEDETIIESRGYRHGVPPAPGSDGECPEVGHPRQVERAIRATIVE